MNRCPYCKAPVNIPRLFTYQHKKNPYLCLRCGKRSRFPRWQEATMAGITSGLFGAGQVLWHGSRLEYYAIGVTAIAALTQGSMATVMRLESIPGEIDKVT